MKAKTIIPLLLIFQFIHHTGIAAPADHQGLPGSPGDFLLTIRNVIQTSVNTLQFDIWLVDADPAQPMELATTQFGITFNTIILNNSPITSGMTVIVPGSSGLPSAMQPVSITTVSPGLIRIAGRSAPGPGNGFIVPSTSAGVRIATLQLSSQVVFASGTTPDLAFTPSTATTPSYATRVAVYQNSVNTQLPVFPGTNALVTENPVLSPNNQPPIACQITGGGYYCEGSQSEPLGLSGSQPDVIYELYRNNVSTNLTMPGTGYPLDFGQQPDGVYTITGTNAYGTTQMNGTVTVAEAPIPVVSISVDQSTLCHGSYANFTSDVSFTEGITYQWFRNGQPVGGNLPTLTIYAADGDNVYLRVTSAPGCSASSNTISLKVLINYASVYFDIYDPIQLISGEEVTLETITYNAGLNPVFEWFVNDVQVPGNDCQMTYVPGPADEVVVKMIPSGEVPCLLDAYYSNVVKIYTCTGAPQAFDVWGETNTCGGEIFVWGLSDTELGVHYYIFKKFNEEYYPYRDFFGTGGPADEYDQSGDYYYLAVNACDSTWMNGHADLYPFDTRMVVSVSDNNICSGTGVIFSAKTNQPESVACTFNWSVNGSSEWNPQPGDFTFAPDNGDIITARMATPCEHDYLHFPDNNRILMMVNDCPGLSTVWNGNINGNWYEPGNWNSGIPGTGHIAVIPGGMPNYPTVTNITRCKSVIIEHGGSFIGGEFLEAPSAMVKCNISDANFHFLSSPVSPDPTFGDVFPYNQQTIWARVYNERYGEWLNMTQYNLFVKARGYSMQLTQPNMARFIGKLRGESVSVVIENYNTSGLQDWAGWNLLGNPYPSGLDWDLMPHNFVEGSVYVWNGTQYISWNGSVGALENGIIPPMNGFFVKMTAPYWKSIMIPASARVHTNAPFYKEQPAGLIRLTVNGNNYKDDTFVHFNREATTGFDPEADARKLWGIEEAPQLYSWSAGKELSINEKPFEPDESTDFGFRCGVDGQFSMELFSPNDFMPGVVMLMEDLVNGNIYNMSENPVFSFQYKTSDPEKRFRLSFRQAGSTGQEAIGLYCSGRKLYIRNQTGKPLDIRILGITGQLLSSESNFSGSVYQLPADAATALYIVQCYNDKATVNQKIIVR